MVQKTAIKVHIDNKALNEKNISVVFLIRNVGAKQTVNISSDVNGPILNVATKTPLVSRKASFFFDF